MISNVDVSEIVSVQIDSFVYVSSMAPHSAANVHIEQFISEASKLGVNVTHLKPPWVSAEAKSFVHSDSLQFLKRLPVISQLLFLVKDFSTYLRCRAKIVPPVSQNFSPSFIYHRPGIFDLSGKTLANQLDIPLAIEINAPVSFECKLNGRPFPLRPLAERIERENFDAAHSIFVVSMELQDYLCSIGVSKKKIVVTSNGVDHKRFDQGFIDETVRTKLSIPNESVVIGFAGSFHPWQGAEVLAKAFETLRQSRSDLDLRLLLMGKTNRLPEIYKNAPGVVCTGQIPFERMPAYFAACDILTAPFLKVDPFYFSPLKLFEYMAMGKPIVASDIGQISRTVVHEKSALLVEPGDSRALKMAIERLVDEPSLCIRLGVNAYEASKEHTWSKCVRTVLRTMGESLTSTS